MDDLYRDRRAARAAGARLYFTCLPCRRGHLAPRRVSDAKCLECVQKAADEKKAAEAKLRDQERAKRDAPKLRAQRAKLKKEAEAREAKEVAKRAAREERARERAKAKAAATRAAKKAAKDAAARDTGQTVEAGTADPTRPPWEE